MPKYPFFHQLEQPSQGYRFNIDSILLTRFAKFHSNDQVCDLGTGVGILGILALKWGEVAQVRAVELQPELAKYARLNIEKFSLQNQMELIEADWREIKHFLKSSSFDVVISNPPYRKKGSGEISKHHSKSIAKHELFGSMDDLLQAANYLLKKKGRFYLIYPVLRLEELISNLNKVNLKIQRLVFIHPFQQSAAAHFMVELVRSVKGEIQVEPPVIVYKNPHEYRPEIEEWVGKKINNI